MKKFLIAFVCIVALGFILFTQTPNTSNHEYLRIHIRANSNSQIDQAVKYKVKDAVVNAMIPIVSTCNTKQQSIDLITKNLGYIESVAIQTLRQNGFSYNVSAQIVEEMFPARSYGDLTLESGFYDALILNLGSGKGDNWWCVVYPPLCFVNGGTEVSQFKSRILEIIQHFKQN